MSFWFEQNNHFIEALLIYIRLKTMRGELDVGMVRVFLNIKNYWRVNDNRTLRPIG